MLKAKAGLLIASFTSGNSRVNRFTDGKGGTYDRMASPYEFKKAFAEVAAQRKQHKRNMLSSELSIGEQLRAAGY
jgi:hypothetical protein